MQLCWHNEDIRRLHNVISIVGPTLVPFFETLENYDPPIFLEFFPQLQGRGACIYTVSTRIYTVSTGISVWCGNINAA